MKHRIAAWIVPTVFLLCIFGIAVFNWCTPDKGFSEMENRYLQQKPVFSLESLFDGSFTKETESWVTDQFFWRDGFIGVKAQSEYLIGKRDSSGIYFAKDGYLIEKHEPTSINQSQTEKNLSHLSHFAQMAQEKLGQGRVQVMIVPTAGEILFEKLPPYAQEFDQGKLLDRIKSMLPEGVFLSVEDELRAHKEEYLYYKTDHHWTTDGAFYAYQAWRESTGREVPMKEDYTREQVSDSFYGTTYSKAHLFQTKPDQVIRYLPKAAGEVTVDYNLGQKQADSLYQNEWLQKKDQYSYFLGGNNAVVKIHSNTGMPNRNLLIIKDSYAHCFVPFLTNDFESVHMIDLRYYNASMKQYMDENEITDVLVLYNAVTFTSDMSIIKIDG